jgi:DNA uptake protein ComE-like DNA-binding protein
MSRELFFGVSFRIRKCPIIQFYQVFYPKLNWISVVTRFQVKTVLIDSKVKKQEAGKMEYEGETRTEKRVNLNSANLEDLENLPMLGRERAENIIKFRKNYGGIRSWDDLKEIAGFSRGLIEDLRQSGATI